MPFPREYRVDVPIESSNYPDKFRSRHSAPIPREMENEKQETKRMRSFASSLAILSMCTQFAGTIISFLRRSKDRRAGVRRVSRSMIISVVWKNRRVARPKQRVVGTEKKKRNPSSYVVYVCTYICNQVRVYSCARKREGERGRGKRESKKGRRESKARRWSGYLRDSDAV